MRPHLSPTARRSHSSPQRPASNANAYDDELWTYDLRARRLRRLGRRTARLLAAVVAKVASSSAYVADDAATHDDQLFALDPASGAMQRLTTGTDVEAFAWRPDGTAIA